MNRRRTPLKRWINPCFLVREGYDLVVTHGNGPQVGNILMRNDAGEQIYNIAQMPVILESCKIDSQGGIGYMIERMWKPGMPLINMALR